MSPPPVSSLFEPVRVGRRELRNRFVHSATYECMATAAGDVTDGIVRRYRRIARGEAGLIITGYGYVHPLGRGFPYQIGICRDEHVPGLTRLARAVHEEGGAVVFQVAHAGRQTTKALIGRTPLAPSAAGRDPQNFVKPREMSGEEIREVIGCFGEAARRAAEAGADGIQLHAAHGYLINEFLSPFFNRRDDEWGGSEDGRFLFLGAIVGTVRRVMPDEMLLLVKLSSNDFTPGEGVTPSLAGRYTRRLAELGVDGVEISCGTSFYSFMNMCRGEVPVDDLVAALPLWKRPVGRLLLKRMAGKFDLDEGYNLPAARAVKSVSGSLPVMVVGGMRRREHMEEVVERGWADLVSLCRPFIREPFLVRKMREGKASSSCVSCNRCLAAITADKPVRCYYRSEAPAGE